MSIKVSDPVEEKLGAACHVATLVRNPVNSNPSDYASPRLRAADRSASPCGIKIGKRGD